MQSHNKKSLLEDLHNKDSVIVDPHSEDSRIVVLWIHTLWIHTTRILIYCRSTQRAFCSTPTLPPYHPDTLTPWHRVTLTPAQNPHYNRMVLPPRHHVTLSSSHPVTLSHSTSSMNEVMQTESNKADKHDSLENISPNNEMEQKVTKQTSMIHWRT